MFACKFLPIFTISKCYIFYIIWGSIIEISVSAQKFPIALFWYKEIKNLLHYQDCTAVFVKMYKIHEHERFLQSRSHNYTVHIIYINILRSLFTCTYICTCIHVHTYIHAFIHAYVATYVHSCMHKTYIHLHECMHAYNSYNAYIYIIFMYISALKLCLD